MSSDAEVPDEVPPARRLQPPHVSHGARVGVRALFASLSLLVLVGSGIAWVTFSNFTASVPHGDRVPALTRGEKDPDGAQRSLSLDEVEAMYVCHKA